MPHLSLLTWLNFFCVRELHASDLISLARLRTSRGIISSSSYIAFDESISDISYVILVWVIINVGSMGLSVLEPITDYHCVFLSYGCLSPPNCRLTIETVTIFWAFFGSVHTVLRLRLIGNMYWLLYHTSTVPAWICRFMRVVYEVTVIACGHT